MSRSHLAQAEARREAEAPLELESQFILRMPEEPAKVLRELLRSGANLKDRCTIRLENDMRYGEVRVDHWLMHAKLIDLPTIVESLKTIDNKSFYKTADICQMMICKEEADQPPANQDDENAQAQKNKKKDPFKVEKKFLWPHGITPPTKNIRKRRFRKTLKKKYAEAPEIEKEVKRLLRIDNDAVSVKWEVLSEEEDAKTEQDPSSSNPTAKPRPPPVKKEKAPKTPKQEPGAKQEQRVKSEPVDVERDIFGGAVSDSDDEYTTTNPNDNSRLSDCESRFSDSNSLQGGHSSDNKFPTQFASDMFPEGNSSTGGERWTGDRSKQAHRPPQAQYRNRSKESVQQQIERLHQELQSLRSQRAKKEQEVASMENLALRQRFQEFLDNLTRDIVYKEMEYRELTRRGEQ